MAKRKSKIARKKAGKEKAAAKTKKRTSARKSAKTGRARPVSRKKTAKKRTAKSRTTAKAKTKKTTKTEKPKKRPTAKPAKTVRAVARKSVPKRPAPPPQAKQVTANVSADLAEAPDDGLDALPKTRLSDQHLAEFRQQLLAKRAALVGDVDNLTNEALRRSRSEAAGDLSSMPIHMADIGSDNWEQEFTLGLIDNERALVREIDDALQRIEDRTYGVCLATHKPITISRLRAKPWAKYCIEYARQREQGRMP